ncbi:MAG TPA: hypothetical protein VJN02_12685 [Gammaproteobacteria bacterium]|nr:hypothetical protein [Gammaproteobacteria bacterium]
MLAIDASGAKRRLLSRRILPWAAKYCVNVLDTRTVARNRAEIHQRRLELDRIARELLASDRRGEYTMSALLARDFVQVLSRIDVLGGN